MELSVVELREFMVTDYGVVVDLVSVNDSEVIVNMSHDVKAYDASDDESYAQFEFDPSDKLTVYGMEEI